MLSPASGRETLLGLNGNTTGLYPPPFNITRASHAVLTAKDLGASRAFYVDALGFVVSDEDRDTINLRGLEEGSGLEPAHVALGHQRTFLNVRFSLMMSALLPKADTGAAQINSAKGQKQTLARYSINSSARPSRWLGIWRPRAFAVVN